jgi:cytochrome c-type biogenesis protein CcmH/NrfG
VPGTTIPALVCAGWLAGRGRLTEAAAPRGATWSRDPLRIGAALAVFATALIVSYAILQPLRSVHSVSAAYAALSRGDYAAASRAAQRAHREDGLSVDPFFALADVSESAGDQAAATAALERAVRLQPRNPDTWSALGQHLLNDLHDPKAAVGPLGAAVYLDPNGLSGQRQLDFVTARQEAGQQ